MGPHILRKIDGLLDMTFVRELTASCYASELGRPSIDPEVFFRMELLAYLYGIKSERRLCEEIHYNLAYRWFCRLAPHEDVPDHSSLSRIRDRYGEHLHAFRPTASAATKNIPDRGMPPKPSVVVRFIQIELASQLGPQLKASTGPVIASGPLRNSSFI